MNIKINLNLIRGILYVREIIHYQSISQTAEKHNIKTANLSTLINELEKEIGVSLFKRSSRGCTPTIWGQQIAEYADEIDTVLQKIQDWKNHLETQNNILNVYIAPNMLLENYDEFKSLHPNISLNFTEDETIADIKITNLPPQSAKEKYTFLHLGQNVQQKIWIYCDDHNSKAMAFFDFIIAKLLS